MGLQGVTAVGGNAGTMAVVASSESPSQPGLEVAWHSPSCCVQNASHLFVKRGI